MLDAESFQIEQLIPFNFVFFFHLFHSFRTIIIDISLWKLALVAISSNQIMLRSTLLLLLLLICVFFIFFFLEISMAFEIIDSSANKQLYISIYNSCFRHHYIHKRSVNGVQRSYILQKFSSQAKPLFNFPFLKRF